MRIQSNVEVTVKTVNQLYNYSTVLGAAIKCKPYSEITVESGTHLKSVKITLNIFAVFLLLVRSTNEKLVNNFLILNHNMSSNNKKQFIKDKNNFCFYLSQPPKPVWYCTLITFHLMLVLANKFDMSQHARC